VRGKKLISTQTSVNKWLERQKGQQWAGDKLLPEIGQVAVHKVQLLSQQGTSKVKQHCKIEKQSANHQNMVMADGSLTLPLRKRVKQRNKPPVIKHSENPMLKQDSWCATELILEPEDNIQT
jgi:hypothetical protein